ncbi:MAG: hypothetical protein RBT40_12970 [Petrimonas sp.]|jgi:uncharacterized protein YcfL|nr:hypothetical protein [Petrimonas sp.]
MRKYFLLTICVLILSGCSIFNSTPRIPENNLSMEDKTLLSFLRTTNLTNIEIKSSDLTEAMSLLNMHIVKEIGYPNGVSYVIHPHETESLASDPFDASAKSIHVIGSSVSIKFNSASLENILMQIASQTGYKVRLSNGIIFY